MYEYVLLLSILLGDCEWSQWGPCDAKERRTRSADPQKGPGDLEVCGFGKQTRSKQVGVQFGVQVNKTVTPKDFSSAQLVTFFPFSSESKIGQKRAEIFLIFFFSF